MRVADYIFSTLADFGADTVFLVTGGGAMHLNDALGREKRLRYICNLHEQACAIAAEGYARVRNKPGILCVTTGPGGTNAITGVVGAWLDSIPMIVISGQVKRSMTIAVCPELNLRQLGDQELNIIDIVKPICKYAEMITEVADIKPALEKAWQESISGRPGPVWLDIPLDIQAATMPEELLQEKVSVPEKLVTEAFDEQVELALQKLLQAKRPVIMAGGGIRYAEAEKHLLELVEKRLIPVLSSISGIDLIASEHPCFFGRPGILGERAANFIMQNADCLLVLGTRMGIRQIGYAYEKVACKAYKIMVDIDENELKKPTFVPDLPIYADVGSFLKKLLRKLPESGSTAEDWLFYCRKMRSKYPVVLEEHRQRSDYVSSYYFPELISKHCQGNEVIVTGNGTAYTSTFQAIPIKDGMRMFANQACAAMGYDLPAAIGAALAAEKDQAVICLTGDGSLQMNLQELQTVKNYKLPIKIFVYNNQGYLSIKLTQNAFFNGNFVGSEENSGIILPELHKIADAYELPYCKISNNQEAEKMLPEIMASNKAMLIEVMTDPFEELGPKAASKSLPDGTIVSAPLEDLAPFLPREEFEENMLGG